MHSKITVVETELLFFGLSAVDPVIGTEREKG
jgi:hypothetical protein